MEFGLLPCAASPTSCITIINAPEQSLGMAGRQSHKEERGQEGEWSRQGVTIYSVSETRSRQSKYKVGVAATQV